MAVKRQYFATVEGYEGEHNVSLVETSPSQYTVNVDGKEYHVDFEKINETIYSVIIDGKSYAVDMTEKGDLFDLIVMVIISVWKSLMR